MSLFPQQKWIFGQRLADVLGCACKALSGVKTLMVSNFWQEPGHAFSVVSSLQKFFVCMKMQHCPVETLACRMLH
jgi:hypothetical protein